MAAPDPTGCPDERPLLAELRRIAKRIARVGPLYERRAEIYQELRECDPPVKHRVIADAAGTTEEAVIQVLRAANRRAQGLPSRPKAGTG